MQYAEFMRQYLANELEIEFNPQGTLAGTATSRTGWCPARW